MKRALSMLAVLSLLVGGTERARAARVECSFTGVVDNSFGNSVPASLQPGSTFSGRFKFDSSAAGLLYGPDSEAYFTSGGLNFQGAIELVDGTTYTTGGVHDFIQVYYGTTGSFPSTVYGWNGVYIYSLAALLQEGTFEIGLFDNAHHAAVTSGSLSELTWTYAPFDVAKIFIYTNSNTSSADQARGHLTSLACVPEASGFGLVTSDAALLAGYFGWPRRNPRHGRVQLGVS
jgi:hypothetical protein